MATWLILVVAALVLAVLGATTEAIWLYVLAAIALVVGIVWAIIGRGAQTGTPSQRGGR